MTHPSDPVRQALARLDAAIDECLGPPDPDNPFDTCTDVCWYSRHQGRWVHRRSCPSRSRKPTP